MKKYILILLALLTIGFVYAQVPAADYSQSTTLGTYTPISGGTLLGDTSTDDQRFVDPASPLGGTTATGVGFPIGFNFTYLGLSFDRVAINANGWISLGQSSLSPAVNISSTSNYTPIGSTTAITPIHLVSRIVGLGRDMNAQTGANIRIETIGTAPERELVVQWTNYRKYNAAGDSFNFQIRLQENGNKVAFVYGTMTNNATATTVQIGLRGTPAATATNWKNLSTTTDWANPNSGASNSASMTLSATVFPVSGITYTWAPPVAGLPPNPAAIVSPANSATNVLISSTLNWASGGGLPSGYKLYFGTTNPPAFIADLGTATTYDPNPNMLFNQTYYWQVVPYNAIGDAADCPVWSFVTEPDPTITAFPWSVDFGTLSTDPFPPTNWKKYGGVLADPTTLGTLGSGSWLQDDWLNNSANPNKAARINIYSTLNGWLITPPIAVPEDNFELKFDLALMAYGNNNPAGQTGTDDIFAVLVGDGNSWTPANVVRQWDNAGSAHIYNNIPNTGINVSLPLGSAGTKYIAFYGISTVSNADNDLMIDNVLVREMPAAPMLSISPTSWDFGAKVIDTISTKSFTISNNGGGTLNISSILISGDFYSLTSNPAPLSLNAGQSASFTVQYHPTAVGTHAGAVEISDNRAITIIDLSASCYDPTITVFPYTQDFETWPPFGWDLTGGTFSFATYTAPNSNKWAMANYWNQNTGNYAIMSLPPLRTQNPSWMRFTWSHLYSTSYPDDALRVEISADNSQWTTLWEKIGTELNSGDGAQNTTVGTGVEAQVSIPSAFVGTTFYLRFYAPSGYGPNLFIDNVIIEDAPAGLPNHVTLTSPADDSTNLNPNNVVLNWTPGSGGGLADFYQVFLSTDQDIFANTEYYFETELPTINVSMQDDVRLGYDTTWYWAVLPHNQDGEPDPEAPEFMVWSFTTAPDPTISSLPHLQNFDSVSTPNLPWGWEKLTDGGATVTTTTTTPHSAPNIVYMYNSGTANANATLITPPIANPINSLKLKFWARTGSVGTNLIVGTVDTNVAGAVFTPIQSIALASANTEYILSLSAYAGSDQYIAFKHGGGGTYRSIYLDTILIEELLADDLAATTISGNAYGMVGNEFSYNIGVVNNGLNPAAGYTLKLMNAATRTELASIYIADELLAGASTQHSITWTPQLTGTYNVYGKVVYGADQNTQNDNGSQKMVAVLAADSFVSQIGDITSSSTANMYPFNLFYRNSLSETIYLAHELQMSSGTINAILYQNNFVQDLEKPIKVWMKNTTDINLQSSWQAMDDYTLVFEGVVSFPAGVNAVVIPLLVPFNYNGANLAVRTYRIYETPYWSSDNVFYNTASPEYPGRTRYYMADESAAFDPTLPPSSGTLVNNIPNTAFISSPANPIQYLDSPVVTIAHSGANVNLSWTRVSGAYAYRIYASDDPMSFGTEPLATLRTTSYQTPATGKKFFKVVAISTYRNTELGVVLNPAAQIGFDNTRFKAEAYIPNTNLK